MNYWLDDNRRHYRAFTDCVTLLLDRDFSPLFTPPVAEQRFRTDHTEAILAVVESFPTDEIRWPLRIFSAGPLFGPGQQWAEALDIEWIGPTTDHDQSELIEVLSATSVVWLESPRARSDLTLIVGHLGWLHALMAGWQLDEVAQRDLLQHLRAGRLSQVQALVNEVDPGALPLFSPQSAQPFFAALNARLASVQPPIQTWSGRMLWDLSMVGRRSYYTGLVFALYEPRMGQPLALGGEFGGGQSPLHQGLGFTLDLGVGRRILGRNLYV